ncbi:hypothetical protein BWK59_09470 [Flavobacterium davisii]|uniref:DUF2272 domain-containing protein n=1 Tax=Flavobacterium davisii TaxID=2906077 RepID=A0A2D0AIG6_9FLAO|nr:hypothetical protein [Flavobacterium davisii]OWP83638.1 hypothetical protein BWK59_09470 [Flavobacterium davisii]
MSEKVAREAEKIANDSVIMNSYKDFYESKGYFLTKNGELANAKRKPLHFPSTPNGFSKKWMDSSWFVLTQRKYLLLLAQFDKDRKVTDADYYALKRAYDNWKSGYYVVFYGEDAKWSCNLFVGESLFMAGYTILSNGKYLSARQIWNGEKLKPVKKENVQIGDIAAFGGTHVEIVTQVRRGQLFEDDEFCSRGAGRGASGNGTEKCDASSWASSREINNDNIKFFRP